MDSYCADGTPIAADTPAVENVTVTVVDAAKTYELTVSAGTGIRDQVAYQAPAGKVFAGWATSTDGTAVYTDQASVTVTEALDLYACWADASIVTFDNNGKTISDRNDMYRNEQVCKKLKTKHGLYFAGGKEQVKQHRLKEPDKSKYEIYTAVKNEIGKSRNWQQL